MRKIDEKSVEWFVREIGLLKNDKITYVTLAVISEMRSSL
jgi:hypothetical protein